MVDDFVKKYYAERRDTNCVKWDIQAANGEIGMAVADMDFKLDDKIVDLLTKRMAHGAYGYTVIPDDYYDAMIDFNKRRHGVDIKQQWVRFSTGAVEGLYQVILSLTKEKDGILVMSPAYMPFYHVVEDTNRELIISKLINNNYHFEMDFIDLENKFKSGKVKISILCSPHNPTGRVWNKEELDKYYALAHQYGVITVSDEVHADIIAPDRKFISSLSCKEYLDDIVVLNSVSKTFNLAMFSHSHIIIPSEEKMKKLDAYRKYYHREVKGGFNAYASYLGFKYGDKWLDDVNEVIFSNYKMLKQRLNHINILPLEGTYLAFIDLSKWCKDTTAAKLLQEKCNIASNAGEPFGAGFEGWVRLNLATKPEYVEMAIIAIEKITK